MKTRPLLPKALAVTLAMCAVTLVACDDGESPTSPTSPPAATADTSAASDFVASEDTPAAPDASASEPDVAPPEPDVPDTPEPVKEEYPAGPYGYAVGDTAPDIELFDPFANRWVKFSEYYQRYDKRILFVSSAAGWCGPCQAEAEELVGLYNQLADQGFEPLYALYEDTNYNPTTVGNPATGAFIQSWKDSFEVNYPLLIDPPRVAGDVNSFALAPFWESDGIPFAFMVTTHDMQVRWKVHGYNPASIYYQILTNLEIVNDWWNEQLNP